MEKIIDNDYYDLIISNTAIPPDQIEDTVFLNFRHSLKFISKDDLDPCILGQYPYNAFPTLYTPTSTISIEKSGIGTVQRNPYLGLFGQGIIIGIIDTGIDYQHPAFLYNDDTTRILSIWDQSIQDGTPPEGFTFGTEYSKELINIALKSDDPVSVVPSTDSIGHGTAIASIIAGTPNSNQSFTGIVPQSELIVVKLKEAKQNLKNIYFVPEDALCYQESDFLLGIKYLQNLSLNMNRPFVLCFAMGSSQGSHDGNSALSRELNYLSQLPGIGITVSAGNEGNSRRHYFNRTTQVPFYNDFELRIGENDKKFSMEIWPYAFGRLSIDISSPSRESTKQILPSFGDCRKYSFVFVPTMIWVNNLPFEEEAGDQLILVRFEDTVPGIWSIRLQSLENEAFSFHSWLPSGDLISNDTFFLNSNPDTTITSPGNGTHQLTVTAYNQTNDSILPESSRGYTRNGMVKPDIACPGYQITCALPGNRYGTLTGSGAAAAHAAGAVAMVMEWAIPKGNFTFINGNDINYLIMRGAYRDSEIIYPNSIWGYGQLDVFNLFQRLAGY